MEVYLTLALFLLVPVLLVVLTKTSAAILYFCVASAVLLDRFVDPSAASVANSLLPRSSFDYMALAVLLVPVIITTFLFKGTVKVSMLPLHVVVAVLTGLTLALTAGTFFPGSITAPYRATALWDTVEPYQTVIVGAGFLLSVIGLSFGKTHGSKKGKH